MWQMYNFGAQSFHTFAACPAMLTYGNQVLIGVQEVKIKQKKPRNDRHERS
jgi:hypothetical protein